MRMDSQGTRRSTARQTIVTVFLTTMAAAFFVLLLLLITGSYFIYLVGILSVIGGFGALHYLLWGRLLTQETAGEREEEQLRQRALADDASDQSNDHHRR
jgi:hypothetical protein